MKRFYVRKSEREAAAKGAALLDEQQPGWASKINLNRLDIASGECCVLGQLFDKPVTVPRFQDWGYKSVAEAKAAQPDVTKSARRHLGLTPKQYWTARICVSNYQAGKRILFLDDQAVIENGFETNIGETNNPRTEKRYDGLDMAWKREVKQRQTVSA